VRWDTQLVRERGGERKRVPWPQHAHLLRRLSPERRRAAGAPLRAVPRPGPRERLGRPRTAPDNILKYTLSRARAKRIKTDALSLPLSPLHPNSGGDGRGSAFCFFVFFFPGERGARHASPFCPRPHVRSGGRWRCYLRQSGTQPRRETGAPREKFASLSAISVLPRHPPPPAPFLRLVFRLSHTRTHTHSQPLNPVTLSTTQAPPPAPGPVPPAATAAATPGPRARAPARLPASRPPLPNPPPAVATATTMPPRPPGRPPWTASSRTARFGRASWTLPPLTRWRPSLPTMPRRRSPALPTPTSRASTTSPAS